MQVRLLELILLQPDRDWTLQDLAKTLGAPQSSVHRELERAENAGIITRDAAARPHRFRAAEDEPLNEPLRELLRRSVGVEAQLRSALQQPGVDAAVIHGSWVTGPRRPESDIDVLVVGDADLRDLRRSIRPVGKAAGRTVDLTLLAPDEFKRMLARRSSFARRLTEGQTTPLVGDLSELAQR
jgi:predicted nucleotidyltransferase